MMTPPSDHPPARPPLPPGFARSAAWPALHIDFPARTAQVFEFTPADYLGAAFLDQRALAHRPFHGFSATLADVAAAMSTAPPDPPPLHWLFHIGHCGSTLISRLLDALPGLLGLREPLPLLELAMRHAQAETPEARTRFDDDLALTLALLRRGFPDTRSILVKPTSVVAVLAPELLARSPASRAIALSMKLRPWLALMLRDPTLRVGMRQQAPARLAVWHHLTGQREPVLATLRDAQVLAMSWLMQQLQWHLLRSADGMAARLMTLDFDDFLADPPGRLRVLATHLGHTADPMALAPGRSAALLARYAKDPLQRFDADTRRREIDAATARFAGEIEAGMAWAQAALAPLHADALQTELG